MGAEQESEIQRSEASSEGRKTVRWFRQPLPIDRFTGWLVFWTALLFVANIGTLFFVGMQWRVANNVQIDTREQLRAVVAPGPSSIIVTQGSDKKPSHYSFVLAFQNFGGTRTGKFSAWDSIQFYPGGVPNNVDFSKPRSSINLANAVIGPNSTYQLPPVTITAEEVERASKGEGKIVIWGRGIYSDIFSSTEHNIAICLLMNPTTKTTTGEIALDVVPYRSDCNMSE